MKKIFFILLSVITFYCNAQNLTNGKASLVPSNVTEQNMQPDKDSVAYDYAALTYSEGFSTSMDVYFSDNLYTDLDLMKKLHISKQFARYHTIFIGLGFLNKSGYELVSFTSNESGTKREYLFKKKKN